MKTHTDTGNWSRFYILDKKNRPVQVSDRDEWSRWIAENDLVFRRTLLEEAGGTITTRFRGVSEAAPVDTPLFVTRVTGMGEEGSQSYGSQTLDAALELHEEIVQKLLRQLTGRE